MTLEERYKASSDNIKSDMYSGMTKFLKDTSKLNIDRIPAKYDTKSRLATKGPKTSRLDIDSIPSKYAPK
jgi:hypothetical protein